MILVVLFTTILVYGWGLFQKISYNRLVYTTSIYEHIPTDALAVINFSRNYHFEDYFELDTTNCYLLTPIKESITYPLAIVQFDKGEDLLLMKATKEQEGNIKNILHRIIAPVHAPKVKKAIDAELLFYSLPNSEFITATFYKGVLAISKDYVRIEQFVNRDIRSNFFDTDNDQMKFYTQKIRENEATSLFINTDSTLLAFAYHRRDSTMQLEGEYFGKLQTDSLKLSYNEMNHALRLTKHYTDSIDWLNENKLQVWINKLPN